MAMWFDWQEKPKADLRALQQICPLGEYRVLAPGDFPSGLVSPGLLAKGDSALMMCSGTLEGRLYFTMNINRIDGCEIDQMPYGVAYESMNSVPSGILVQHGSYHNDRTTPLPEDFDHVVRTKGFYPLGTMPLSPIGQLSDIYNPSQLLAFELVVAKIREAFPERSP